MSASSHLLFFFSSLGAFNGLLLALFLLLKKDKQATDNWLAILLILLSVRIGKSVAFYFTPTLDKSILQLGLTACLLIGPCILAYIAQSTLNKLIMRRLTTTLSCFTVATVIIGILFPYQHYLELWQYWIYRGSSYLWLISLVVSSVIYVRKNTHKLALSKHLLTQQPVVVLAGSWLIWVAYFTASYTSYIMGALSFSLVLYLTLLLALKSKWQEKASTTQSKYHNNKLSTEQTTRFSSLLNNLIQTEQVYLDPQLTLPRLAKRMGITHTQLSQLLNDHYQLNFKQFINTQRITKAKESLKAYPEMPVEEVAERCGFSASSTFYSTFKQQTGMTPNQYRTTEI
ncbi:MAG: DNA-binding protein [Pseudoalteromonas sp.]|nr:DNA-binding protein [Pseudoalteromonas sp.]